VLVPRQWILDPRPLTRARVDHPILWINPVSPAAIEGLAPVLELLDQG
jgi:hypothetical protein